jgi:hypothetical protein
MAVDERIEKSQAQKLEGVAFTFCKCATVALICGRFALPVAALLAAGFFVAAFLKGEKETRCVVGKPLIVAGLWVLVATGWVWFNLVPAGIAMRASWPRW